MSTAENYVAQKTAASGSSFYYAFLFLPKDKRAAITAFYAFCREVDDVVDEVSDPHVAAQKLAWWRSDVEQSFAAVTPLAQRHPVMQALWPHCAHYGITREHLLAVIQGCQMDLEQNHCRIAPHRSECAPSAGMPFQWYRGTRTTVRLLPCIFPVDRIND